MKKDLTEEGFEYTERMVGAHRLRKVGFIHMTEETTEVAHDPNC